MWRYTVAPVTRRKASNLRYSPSQDRLLRIRNWQIGSIRAASVGADSKYEEVTDLLIVGSGGAGLCAALRAKSHSLKALVVEKHDKIGGTTAWSGGGLWIPNNPFNKAQGRKDGLEEVLKYLELTIGDVGPASSLARRVAFLKQGPEMVNFLQTQGFKWKQSTGYPDYFPNLEGGSAEGRSIEGDVFDGRKLGTWKDLLHKHESSLPIPIHTNEAAPAFRAFATLAGLLFAARIVITRAIPRRLMGQQPLVMGQSLVGQLLYLATQRNIDIWLKTSLVRLLTENGAVVGAVIHKDNKELRIRAKRGVLLAAGGFAYNAEMRRKYQQEPIGTSWTSAPPIDTGDAIRAGMEIDAATALMDDAWWGPTLVDPISGKRFFTLMERCLPYSIVVDSHGQRFFNECESYALAGQHQYQRDKEVPAIPAWFILDSRHRKRYLLAGLPTRKTPESALASGFVTKADTLLELANKIGIDAKGLESTVQRFNKFARQGKDEDFGRGGSAYDKFFADPTIKPNGNLGPLEKGPFYAAKMWPGDLGTKGGLLTDEYARVLRKDGKFISGLYAAGNTSASVMGRTYPGPGSTLGPALTFGFIAANHAAGNIVRT